MHPELFTLPGGYTIKTYGFFLMIGFLSAVWLAMRRASRVKADPDVVLDLSFLALLFGVAGARAFYVIHYWKTQFADAPNRLLAIIDITQGGLEFLGGFLGAVAAMVVYARWKRVSIRLYLDILAPSTMWGLAFGRIGCFFNGCCFGSLCLGAVADNPARAWAIEFPYASPAHWRQWEDRQTTVPAELITTRETMLTPDLIPESQIHMSVNRRLGPIRTFEDLTQQLKKARAEAPESKETKALEAKRADAREALRKHSLEIFSVLNAQEFPSRVNPERKTSVSELEELAAAHRSLPVHPTQLYSAAHAFLLSWLLSALFYRRKRHGVVAALLLVLYPVPRAVLEIIRADNPADVGGWLTASQFVSLCMLAFGVAALIVLHKKLPERSPVLAAAGP